MKKAFLFLALAIWLPAFGKIQYDYPNVIDKSIQFYLAQRTGVLPASNPIPWRGDSFVDDKGINGEDLSGGYFDAGDFVKFGFPFSSAMTMLAWGLVDSVDGYKKAGYFDDALDTLRWGMDYMIKAHPSPNVFYVQVGNGQLDHNYWGRPEDWTPTNVPRPALQANSSLPASEVAGESADALAAASIAFREDDPNYSDILLQHAKDLYTFATTYRGDYHISFPEIEEFYKSWSGYGDEFAWSAKWLFRATGCTK